MDDKQQALSSLNTTLVDTKSRTAKYNQRLEQTKNTLLKRVKHAIQEITLRGTYMIRIHDTSSPVRSLAFRNDIFHVWMIGKKGETYNIDSQSNDWLINLATVLTGGGYSLITHEDDDVFAAYVENIFPATDDNLQKSKSAYDAAYAEFRKEFLVILVHLKSLGLGLKLKGLDTSAFRSQTVYVQASNLNSASLEFYTSGRVRAYPDEISALTEIRKQIKDKTVTILPCFANY